MVQMSLQDQAVIKALPGNDTCSDCPVKNPEWASVSFGNVFCLECSGIHRSLGVHISFVRSIRMDSWTQKQLDIMRTGGNDKLNAYLKNKNIQKTTPIKQKYENDHAQLYKEILKARAEGRPEPTSLPKKTTSAPSSMNRPMGAVGSSSMGGGSQDANGMERLAGETEQQYVARQTRLRDEARARMKAKFGGGGMGGVGSSGMQGIGSNPNYNPNGGGYDLDNMVSGVSSAFSSGLSLMGSVASTAVHSVNSDNISSVRGSVSSMGGSFWSSLSSGINQVADTITTPDGNDGLADLQKQFSSNRPTQSKYSGFGSDNSRNGGSGRFNGGQGFSSSGNQFNPKPTIAAIPPSNGSSALGEAPGLPGEDRNGIQRLTGESDEQYVARQTRIRDEAKARMAAKFGGGGLSSASSSSNYPASSMSNSRVAPAPASANFAAPSTRPKPAVSSAPRSGGFVATTPPRKMSSDNLSSDDFFASFGT